MPKAAQSKTLVVKLLKSISSKFFYPLHRNDLAKTAPQSLPAYGGFTRLWRVYPPMEGLPATFTRHFVRRAVWRAQRSLPASGGIPDRCLLDSLPETQFRKPKFSNPTQKSPGLFNHDISIYAYTHILTYFYPLHPKPYPLSSFQSKPLIVRPLKRIF
jgi:hypothetical protein